jgi:NSS family neurotransmitter:Na+ symporter
MGMTTGDRESFATRLGLLASMIGVAVGLGNVWRFPYMVGKFGGASFVLIYVLAVILLGIPALIAEWSLGANTRRGPVGAFARAGLPCGRHAGWFFFFIVTAATAYYTNAVGWVLYYAVGELARAIGLSWAEAAVLPPQTGFDARALILQLVCTSLVILGCVLVLRKGIRAGIERVSKVVMPVLLVILVILIVRSVTLPGAAAGIEWYILKVDFAALTPQVVIAALGQAFFSLSLGGTFMVVYGSYLGSQVGLGRNAVWTATGDLIAGLLAGLAIMPAVFAFGLTPESGPGLLFFTLPSAFAEIPGGWIFGLLFFTGLLGAAFLSDVAAFEVLVAGITDNTRTRRKAAIWLMAGIVLVLAVPPMINMRIFVPWDLTFGSGMQTLGSLLAVIAFAWFLHRRPARPEDAASGPGRWLLLWLRFVVPGAILTIGIWWLLDEVLGVVG